MNIKTVKKKCKNLWKTASAGMVALAVSFMSTMPAYADDIKAVSYTHLDVYKRQESRIDWKNI